MSGCIFQRYNIYYSCMNSIKSKSETLTFKEHLISSVDLFWSRIYKLILVDLVLIGFFLIFYLPFNNLYIGLYQNLNSILNQVADVKNEMQAQILFEQIAKVLEIFLTTHGQLTLALFLYIIYLMATSTVASIYILGKDSSISLKDVLLISLINSPIFIFSSVIFATVLLLVGLPLILPALVLMLYLQFFSQEIVLKNRKIYAAFDRSINLVGLNFSLFLKRFVLITVISMMVNLLIEFSQYFIVIDNNFWLYAIFYFLTYYFIAFFTLAYWVRFYQFLDTKTPVTAKVSKKWIYFFLGLGTVTISLIIALILLP